MVTDSFEIINDLRAEPGQTFILTCRTTEGAVRRGSDLLSKCPDLHLDIQGKKIFIRYIPFLRNDPEFSVGFATANV